jgi:myo-inositol-1(or 4)-monophosphatase
VTDLDRLLGIATEAVALGADLLRTGMPGAVLPKGDRDMASELDIAIERLIRGFLAEQTPQIGLIGEEEGEVAGSSGLTWALDPIDGTVNFLHGVPLCGVSLGLIGDSTSLLGVVDLPLLGTRYTAADGLGAWCNDQPIRASRCDRLDQALVAIGDYAVGPGAAAKNAQRLAITASLAERVQRLRLLGSAVTDLAWVAAGRLDACVLNGNNPWDTAAGVAIAREAGAVVLALDGSPHTATSVGTVAVAEPLADDLLAVIRAAS